MATAASVDFKTRLQHWLPKLVLSPSLAMIFVFVSVTLLIQIPIQIKGQTCGIKGMRIFARPLWIQACRQDMQEMVPLLVAQKGVGRFFKKAFLGSIHLVGQFVQCIDTAFAKVRSTIHGAYHVVQFNIFFHGR